MADAAQGAAAALRGQQIALRGGKIGIGLLRILERGALVGGQIVQARGVGLRHLDRGGGGHDVSLALRGLVGGHGKQRLAGAHAVSRLGEHARDLPGEGRKDRRGQVIVHRDLAIALRRIAQRPGLHRGKAQAVPLRLRGGKAAVAAGWRGCGGRIAAQAEQAWRQPASGSNDHHKCSGQLPLRAARQNRHGPFRLVGGKMIHHGWPRS